MLDYQQYFCFHDNVKNYGQQKQLFPTLKECTNYAIFQLSLRVELHMAT